MTRHERTTSALPVEPGRTGRPDYFARWWPTRVTVAALAVGLLIGFSAPASWSQDSDRKQMKGLDDQVQEVKSDVLAISAELNRLEEKLLFPSNTQVAVFVALAEGDTTRLDAVQIHIDGQLAAHYIYSFKELDALRKGGVQRIYVGNVATGEHQIDVAVTGKLEGGGDYNQTGQFAFHKGVQPKLVGLTVAGPESGKPAIEIGDW